jgi:hypothetical protein
MLKLYVSVSGEAYVLTVRHEKDVLPVDEEEVDA